jgi:hypothetical protein
MNNMQQEHYANRLVLAIETIAVEMRMERERRERLAYPPEAADES